VSNPSHDVMYNVATPMRDAVNLRADVYLPKGDGPFATLVCRTPYDKSGASGIQEFVGLAEAGFAVVVQDLRGRWASDGDWVPFFAPGWTDAEDGYDTIEWAAEQSWSTGKIGTFGNSYKAWTQWALAPTKPPHLTAMWAGGMGPRMSDLEVGGVLRTGRVMGLVFGMLAIDTQKWLETPEGPNTQDWWEMLHDSVNRDKWLWFLPFKDLPEEALGGLGDYFKEWLANHQRDVWAFDSRFPEIDVPVFHRTGWYDRLAGAAKMFAGMQANGESEATRANQRLIIGPWPHSTINIRKWPEIDFGPEAEVPHGDLLVE
jgi:putative CocE/NonD family hydrolase